MSLLEEGLANEIKHGIQMLRKKMGLDLNNQIFVQIQGQSSFSQWSLYKFRKDIAKEVQATEFEIVPSIIPFEGDELNLKMSVGLKDDPKAMEYMDNTIMHCIKVKIYNTKDEGGRQTL